MEKAKHPTAVRTLQFRNKIVTQDTGIGPFRTVTVYVRFTTGVVRGRVPYAFASTLRVPIGHTKHQFLSVYTLLHILALIA
jgi:hypothetical protein